MDGLLRSDLQCVCEPSYPVGNHLEVAMEEKADKCL